MLFFKATFSKLESQRFALTPYDLVRLNLLNEMREDTYNYDFARYVNFHVHVDAHYHSNI